MAKYLYSILVIIKLLAVREGDAYGSGAPASACTNLTPGHGVQLAGNNPFTISVQQQVSGSLFVTISSSDNSDFQGFILQAREIGSNTPLADFRNPPTHTQLIRCTRDMDTATHSDTTAKKSVTFTWVPNPGDTAKLRFHATVAINKGNYWKGIVSEEINLPLAGTTTQLPSTSAETTTPYSIPPTRQTATETLSMTVSLPNTDSQSTNASTNQPPPTTVDTNQTVNGSVPQTTVTMLTTAPSGSSKTSAFMLLVINLILIMSVLLL